LPNALREFVLVSDMSTRGGDIPQPGDPKFSIAASGKPQNLRRAWFDTFDWRLFHAGLTLELTADRGTTELRLTGRDGELVATELAGSGQGRQLRWPCRIEELPLGPLREHLAPVVGVRALLPVAEATSVLTERRGLNEDDKTIAMLTVDKMTVTGHRSAAIPVRIAVEPLRGYQAQAAKLADSLAQIAGVLPATASSLESALSAADKKPGDYTSKINVELAAEMPAALAVTLVLERLFDTVEANLPGTLGDIDTEFLHDLRVAVRRTRSVLKLAGSVLPADLVNRYRPEFKWLGDLTTPTRDLDVYLIGYPSMTRQLVAATGQELRPFQDYLRRQRALSCRQLARGLRSAKFSALASQWRHDLAKIAQEPAPRPAAGKFAARRIATAHQKVLRRGSVIDANSPPQALHELRKRCKELRYLLEVFASLHDPAEQWRAVRELKALQDCLGEFQDTEVQRAELRAFATQMMADRSAPAETLLAMGEIATTLAGRQQAARREFAGRFAEFASPQGRARISALARGAA